ncbi:SurA N-terminal domain-containing protein [Sphingomonas sp. RT2P30]|uniref:peptidylprolyl isomerase n=1 Tax=Parasphingomonas halimpatiens TaxID=3096162 RepID=UPI002FC58DFB
MISLFRRMINSRVGLTLSFLALFGFALLGLGGSGIFTGGGFGGTTASGDDVAKVGKVAISGSELRARVESEYQNYFQEAQQARQQPLPLAQFITQGGMDGTYERLINSQAIEQFATRQRMSVDDKYALAQITPQFLNAATGKFDQRKFEQVLQAQHLTVPQVTRDVRQGLLQRQLVDPIMRASQVPTRLAFPYASMLLERRDGQVGLIPASAIRGGAAPTDTELADFYKRNTARYMVPERRVVRYAIISPDQVKAQSTPTDKEVADTYQNQRARYLPSEKRTIVQVLVADQVAAGALAAKVKGGTSLEAAAQAIGLSAATIKDTEKAAYAAQGSEALATAAFGATRGAMVGPISTPLGYAVARIEAITAVPGKSLAQAHDEIVKALTAVKTQTELGKLHDAIDDAISNKTSFGDVVNTNKLTAVTSAPLTANGANPDDPKAQPDPNMVAIAQAAFAIDPAQGPQMAPIGADGSFALVAIDHIVAAAPRPLAQMRDTVARDFVAERNLKEARKIAYAMTAQLAKGVPIAKALAGTGLALKPAQTVSAARVQVLNRPNNAPAPQWLALMFNMGARTAKVLETPDHAAYLVIWLDKVTPGDATTQPRAVSGISADLSRSIGREYAEQFVKAMRSTVGVSKNDAAMARLRASLSGQASPDQP